MANSLSASFPEYWSRRMQRKHYKTDRYREIVSMEEQKTLKKGDTVHRPYRSSLTVNDLGSEGSYTRQDITNTDESLAINKEKEISFYVRDIDDWQSNYKEINEYADDAAVKLGNQIDGDVLGEYDQADSDVDDGDLGGTNDNGISLTTSNIDKVFGEANEALDALDIDQDNRWAMISPQFYNVLWQRIGGRDTMLGDKSGERGHAGSWAGFKLIRTNALGWSAVLSMATIATDTDTITINGVVFTADGDGAAVGAGHFSIQTTADLCRAQLADAINNTNGYAAGVGAVDTYIEVSAADRALIKGIVATNDNSADTLTLKMEGRSYFAVSETLTDATDTWTAAKQIQHNLFGQGKPIDLVIQKKPSVQSFHRDGYVGSDVVSYVVYGIKTFDEGDAQMVDVKIRSDAF